MQIVKKLVFDKRTLLLLIVVYVIFCQSCMRMRSSDIETKQFFTKSNVNYIDSVISINKRKIHYIQTGKKNKPTLLFIHGSPGSWDAFKEYLKDSLLLQKYRMIAIDRPGFGYSNFGKAQNIEEQTQQIQSFIQSIRNEFPLVLIGHSMGGPVITNLATQHPEDFSHLLILAGAIDPSAETPEKWRPIIKAFPLRFLIPGALRPANDELWWLKNDLKTLQVNLKKITSKTIIIHGMKDQLVPHSNVKFIQDQFTNAKSIQTISIPEANHFIPWTHYKIIKEALLGLEFEILQKKS